MNTSTRNLCAVFLSAALFMGTEYLVLNQTLLTQISNKLAEKIQTEPLSNNRKMSHEELMHFSTVTACSQQSTKVFKTKRM